MNVSKSKMNVLIKVKTHLEKKAHMELMKIRDTKEKETQSLTSLVDAKHTAAQEAEAKARSKAVDLQANVAFLKQLSEKIEDQRQKVQEIRLKEDAKREELVEKSKSRKMVEKLTQKKHEEMMKETDRKEQGLNDVLAQRTRKRS